MAQRSVMHKLVDDASQCGGIICRDEQTGFSIDDHIEVAADGRRNAGQPAGHCFEERVGQAFPARRQNDEIGGGKNCREVGPPTCEVNARLNVQFLAELAERLFLRAVAHQQKIVVGNLREDGRQFRQESVETFLWVETAHIGDDSPACRYAKLTIH